MRTKILLFSLLFAFSSRGFAFLTFNESAEMTPQGQYRLAVEPQIRMTEGAGTNLGFFAESSLSDEWSWRAQFGGGQTDFWAGASAKWIPIPDYEKQPGIGLRPEVLFGRDESETFTIFRISPLISKKLETEVGLITPFAAFPIGLFAWQGKSENITQLILGAEGRFDKYKNLLFSAEFGLNLGHTFSYISGSVSFFFGDSKN